jgi:hypothetical protein
MTHSHLALCLLLLISDAVAQSPNPKQPPTSTPATAPTPAPNPDGQINDRHNCNRTSDTATQEGGSQINAFSILWLVVGRTTHLLDPERTHSNSSPERYVKI